MSDRLRVLVASSDGAATHWVASALGADYEVVAVRSATEVMNALGLGWPKVIVIVSAAPASLLGMIRDHDGEPVTTILIGAGADFEPDAGVFYAIDRHVSEDQLVALVAAAGGLRVAPPAASSRLESRSDAAHIQRMIELTRPLALQQDLRAVAATIIKATEALIEADRAACLFYDADTGALWTEDGEPSVQTTAFRGVTGYAARTGLPVIVDYARDEPLYHGPTDDPRGDGNERLLVRPIAGGDGQVHCVIVAARKGTRTKFTDNDSALMRSLADHAGPLMHQVALQMHASSILDEGVSEQDLFRREAVEAMANEGKQGDVIRVSPAWVSWAYWLVVALVVAAGVYAVFGRINKYSSGPAVVRVAGRTEINANLSGSLTDLYVAPGQAVKPGQLMARFYDAEESADYERILREFQRQLRNRMLNRGDAAAAQAVQALRERRDEAEARLSEREVRAPHAGTVSDLRVRIGQQITPGDTILSLVTDDTELSVLAFLPGGDRPRLEAGMPLRLELHNYQYAYQHVTIDAVDAEVIGPQEAQRYLGPKLADVLRINGPVVLVRATLPSPTFEADGIEYRYFDGMAATAEVRVDSEPIYEAIVPGLKRMK